MLAQSKYFGNHWINVKVEHDMSLMAVVGAGMAKTPGIAGKVFTTLGDKKINICSIAQGSSELNISFVIKNSDLKRAIETIYHKFVRKNEFTVSFW